MSSVFVKIWIYLNRTQKQLSSETACYVNANRALEMVATMLHPVIATTITEGSSEGLRIHLRIAQYDAMLA